MKKRNNASKSEKALDIFSVSWILYYICLFSEKLYDGIKNSFVGNLLTAYEQEQGGYDSGFIKNHFTNNLGFKRYLRTIRMHLSKQFEGSLILNLIQRSSLGFATMPLRTLGNFFFSFGIYTVIIYLLRLFLPVISVAPIDYAVVGVIICGASIPMILARDNIAVSVGKSVFLGSLFSDIFGYRRESFKMKTQTSKFKSAITFILGLGLGLLTLVIHPLAIIGILAAIVAFALIFVSPEIGVILALFCLPFFSLFNNPTIILSATVLAVIISYCIKLIRGKRILRFEIIDLSVLLFGVLILMSGAISAGGIASLRESLVAFELMLGFFITVNLMRTAEWIKRCFKAIVASGTVVAFIGIVQYVIGAFPDGGAWLDTEYFYDISGRAVSLFDNPNILAVYLILVLPISLYFGVTAQKGSPKVLASISTISILICILLTWSRGAWIAATICIVCFFLLYSKKTLACIFALVPIIPMASIFIPDSVTRRILSIGDLADSSTMYRVYTWKGTLECIKDNILGGIGYGPSAFQTIYPQYAYAGMESAEHSHSLFLQILLGMGIVGLIVFGVIIFLYAQMNFEYIKNSNDISGRLTMIACLCAVLGLLIFGLFDYSWYSYRVFFLFWTIMGLACAYVRVNKNEMRKKQVINEQM